MKRIYLLILLIFLAVGIVFVRVSKTLAPERQAKRTTDTKQADTSRKETSVPGFDKNKYSTSNPSSIWVVANKTRPLQPISYAPTDLVFAGNGQRLRQEAATALVNMFSAAKSEGLTLTALSGYRSYQTQVAVYSNEVKKYGQIIADSQSAKPGHSEHQTGWAVDIGGGGCGIEDCFGNTKEGKWVAENGFKFGYIVRYNAGNQVITGYRAEPWHIRYVGVELATEMHKTGVDTLEKFFDL